MTSVFYNVLGQFVADKARLVDLTRQHKPKWALVMDDLALARDMQTASPGTNVIVRFWPDDGLQYLGSPEDFLARKQHEVGLHTNLWVYTTNEPGFSDEIVDWHIRVIELNRQLGRPFKLVIMNLSVGTPEPGDWLRPNAQKLLRLLDEEREHVVLGLHEYFHGVVTAGLQGVHYNLDYQNWPTTIDPNKPNWLVGRFMFLVKACQQLGVKPPRMVITEYGADSIGTWEGWFKPNGGWQALAGFWQKFMNMSTVDAYLLNLLYPLRVIYPGLVEAALIFQYGAKSPRWASYNVEGFTDLHNGLMAWENQQTPPVPPQVPGWRRGQHTELYNVNVRNKPSVAAGQIIGRIKVDLPFWYIEAPNTADWWLVVLETGETGYAAKSVLKPK